MSPTRRQGIPLPRPTELTRPHWDGCRAGELRYQRCTACDSAVFIPQPVCPGCFGDTLGWAVSAGRGTVYSYTVVHRPQRPVFQVPYAVAIIELDEGFAMLTNLIGCSMDAIEIGMPVEVSFEQMSDEITLPYFRPVSP